MIAQKIFEYIKRKLKLRNKIKETKNKFKTNNEFIKKQRNNYISSEKIKEYELFLNKIHKKRYLKLLYLSSNFKCPNCNQEFEISGNYTRHIRLYCFSCNSKKDFYFENGLFALENCVSSFRVQL